MMQFFGGLAVAFILLLSGAACGTESSTPRASVEPSSEPSGDESSPAEEHSASAGSEGFRAILISCNEIDLDEYRSVVRPDGEKVPDQTFRVQDPDSRWTWIVAEYADRGIAAWLLGPPGTASRARAGDDLAQVLTPSAPRADEGATDLSVGRDEAASCVGDRELEEKLMNEDLPPGFE